jgi:hypothetical protein
VAPPVATEDVAFAGALATDASSAEENAPAAVFTSAISADATSAAATIPTAPTSTVLASAESISGQPIQRAEAVNAALPEATTEFAHAAHSQAQVNIPRSSEQAASLTLESVLLDERLLVETSVLSYLAMVASLIERRWIGRGELLGLLRTGMRQRSIVVLPRHEYVLRYLKQRPP